MAIARSFSPRSMTHALMSPRLTTFITVGTIGNIVQSVKMPDGNIKVLVEGIERAKAVELNDADGFFVATVRTSKIELEITSQIEQLMQRVTSLFEQYVKLQQSLNYETMIAAVRTDEPSKLADTIAANLQLAIRREAGAARYLRSQPSASRVSPTYSTSKLKSSTWIAASSRA